MTQYHDWLLNYFWDLMVDWAVYEGAHRQLIHGFYGNTDLRGTREGDYK